MEYKLTEHAKQRKRERGFSDSTIRIILENGTCKTGRKGATEIFFGKREYQNTVQEFKKAIQLLDKAKGGTIIASDNKIITMYKK